MIAIALNILWRTTALILTNNCCPRGYITATQSYIHRGVYPLCLLVRESGQYAPTLLLAINIM